jgi:hypothetical protein
MVSCIEINFFYPFVLYGLVTKIKAAHFPTK